MDSTDRKFKRAYLSVISEEKQPLNYEDPKVFDALKKMEAKMKKDLTKWFRIGDVVEVKGNDEEMPKGSRGVVIDDVSSNEVVVYFAKNETSQIATSRLKRATL